MISRLLSRCTKNIKLTLPPSVENLLLARLGQCRPCAFQSSTVNNVRHHVNQDLKKYFMEKDKGRVDMLKLVLHELNRVEKEKQLESAPVDNSHYLEALSKMAQQLKATIQEYEYHLSQLRQKVKENEMKLTEQEEAILSTSITTTQQLLDKECQQLSWLKLYLPAEATLDEMEMVIQEAIRTLNVSLPSPKSFGLLMKHLCQTTDSVRFPRKILSDLIKKALQ